MRTHAEPLLRQVLAGAPPAARNAAIALGASAAASAAPRPMADAALANFESSDQPGRWRPTPPNFRRSSIFMNEPLLFPRRDSLRIPPPPALDSQRYAGPREVRRMGGQVRGRSPPTAIASLGAAIQPTRLMIAADNAGHPPRVAPGPSTVVSVRGAGEASPAGRKGVSLRPVPHRGRRGVGRSNWISVIETGTYILRPAAYCARRDAVAGGLPAPDRPCHLRGARPDGPPAPHLSGLRVDRGGMRRKPVACRRAFPLRERGRRPAGPCHRRTGAACRAAAAALRQARAQRRTALTSISTRQAGSASPATCTTDRTGRLG